MQNLYNLTYISTLSAVLDIHSDGKAFQIQLNVFILSGSQEVRESLAYVSTLYPAKTQNGSPRVTELFEMPMSAFILECHKMLLIIDQLQMEPSATRGGH